MIITDKLTLLANSKEAFRAKLGLPESLPLSEYYKYATRKPFEPSDLFIGGKQGVWYDPSDKSTLFQDVAGTVPVTKDGDPVALMRDKSGNDNHAEQTISTARPIYKTDGELHWLEFDGVDDCMTTNYQHTIRQTLMIAMSVPTATPTQIVWGGMSSVNTRAYLGFKDRCVAGAIAYLVANDIKDDVILTPGNVVVAGLRYGDTYQVLRRGAVVVDIDAVGSTQPSANNTLGAIFRDGKHSAFYKGSLYGLTVIPEVVDTDDISVYLANKSGVNL